MKNRYIRFFAIFLTVVLTVCSLPAPVHADSASQIRSALSDLKARSEEIKKQISEVKDQYDANASEIQDLVNKKNAIDQEIALLHEQVALLNEQVRIYGQLIADSQEQLEDAEVLLTQLNDEHLERIQAMEERGRISYWQVIFESHSFTDFVDRVEMINEIAAADQRRLDEMKAAADIVAQTQQQLNEERDGMEQSLSDLADNEAALETKRTESDEILRDLISKQAEFQELLDLSEAMQDSLMKQIAQKQAELAAAEYQEELVREARNGKNPPSKASWQTPVSGYTITSAFGMRVHPVYGYALMHNGIDMSCPPGTPIYATRAGTVTKAAYQAGGAGYYVSLNHGDGFGSIYMHMTRYVVSTGNKVKKGQLIGYVGSTGVSTGPHLHFGVSYGGVYVNPLAYIG